MVACPPRVSQSEEVLNRFERPQAGRLPVGGKLRPVKRIALFITLTLSASAQPEWTHRAWEGEFWGEPARLEEWWGDHGYLRNVRLLHFPFSEWSVLEANGDAYEIDCKGGRCL